MRYVQFLSKPRFDGARQIFNHDDTAKPETRGSLFVHKQSFCYLYKLWWLLFLGKIGQVRAFCTGVLNLLWNS